MTSERALGVRQPLVAEQDEENNDDHDDVPGAKLTHVFDLPTEMECVSSAGRSRESDVAARTTARQGVRASRCRSLRS